MINNKYKIEKYITQGNFGSVYECSYNNKHYAIKSSNQYDILKYEANIYKKLRFVNNISKLIDYFFYDSNHYLVLDLYKINLKEYKEKSFTSELYRDKLINILITLITTLNDIHDLGIVHRDLKPTNICLDYNFEPYIIDFGMAKQIIINNKHIEEKKIKNIIGSPNYISLNVVNLIEPSRRDDMESVIYIIIYMILTNKEYLEYTSGNLEEQKSMFKISKFILKTGGLYNNLIQLLLYLRKLHFSQKPNYDLFINKLSNKH